MQTMAEWAIGVAVVAEPYFVPPQPNWVRDTDEVVAIVVPAVGDFPPLARIEGGPGFVAAGWGSDTVLVAVYFSPNRPLREFDTFLGILGGVVRRAAPRQVMVLGDLNAKSSAWGSPATDPRGASLEDWVTATGLVILNQGSANTCVRRQGGSIVDITFATPAIAARVTGWRVLEDVETLSDHLYIRMRVSNDGVQPSPILGGNRRRRGGFPKWSLVHLDRDRADEAAMVEAWCAAPPVSLGVEERAAQFRVALQTVCDAAMPRTGRLFARKKVYWWSAEIAALRTTSNSARRAYQHCRRRRHTAEEEEGLHRALKEAKGALQVAIAKAKDEANALFLATLDRDPWGRPYKVVRNKMRTAPPMDSLEPALLQRVVEGLFPPAPTISPPSMADPIAEPEAELVIAPISSDEFERVTDRLRGCKKAPGPDGVPGRVLAVALQHLGDRLRHVMDDCLREGRFPRVWKEGRLCLLRKEGRPPDCPSAYRPIVLLDEAGKAFERILASRILQHLETAGPNVSDRQFGFREGRSTLDALKSLRDFSEYASSRGEGVIAVSLDIANAFGTLPYGVISEALRYHEVPHYLRRVIEHYLTERVVLYENKDGQRGERVMACGVPQGSVLGPLLWNLGYDWAIRGELLPRTLVVCYADDTMVAVRGSDKWETSRRAEVAADLAIERIARLGLKVSLPKTEAIVFGGRGWRLPADAALTLGGGAVLIKPHIKYLGLILDRKWDFGEHFSRLAPRIVGAASAMGRLLPNVGGPGSLCRRLYAGVTRSMALYGAPIWADKLSARNRALLRRPQRVVALRMVRAYVTVAHAAACLLACTPPWELDAEVQAETYRRRSRVRATGERPDPEEVAAARRMTERRLRDRWKAQLEVAPYGVRTIGAILPSLDHWSKRAVGAMTFRLVQVMTGHGCFGHYLHKIGRELGPQCHECGDPDDTAQHTLEVCSRWDRERGLMARTIQRVDLSLQSIVSAMLSSERSWEAVVAFCEYVISQKETAEREREEDPLAHPLRRRRQGRRRRRFAARLNP